MFLKCRNYWGELHISLESKAKFVIIIIIIIIIIISLLLSSSSLLLFVFISILITINYHYYNYSGNYRVSHTLIGPGVYLQVISLNRSPAGLWAPVLNNHLA